MARPTPLLITTVALSLGLLAQRASAQEGPPSPPAPPPAALPPAAPLGPPPMAPPLVPTAPPGPTPPVGDGAAPAPFNVPPPQGFSAAPYPYPPPPYGYAPPPPMKLPDVLPYVEGRPIPPGYVLVERSHLDIAAVGGAIFLLGYLPSVYVGALVGAAESGSSNGGDDFAPLYIPVAGPFVTIETANANATGSFWLVLLGVAQAGGMITGITGLAMPDEQLLYRRDLALTVAPVIAQDHTGVSVVGAF